LEYPEIETHEVCADPAIRRVGVFCVRSLASMVVWHVAPARLQSWSGRIDNSLLLSSGQAGHLAPARLQSRSGRIDNSLLLSSGRGTLRPRACNPGAGGIDNFIGIINPTGALAGQ
jgi:hypothetical protein